MVVKNGKNGNNEVSGRSDAILTIWWSESDARIGSANDATPDQGSCGGPRCGVLIGVARPTN